MKKLKHTSVLCLLSISLFAQLKYPETKKIEVIDTYFGVDYKDSYRWLENLKDPEAISWFKSQADLTNSTMSKISGRDELITEWKKLDKIQPAVYFSVIEENGRYFYQKRMPGEVVSKVYFREGINGKEQFLFDPQNFISGKTLAVQQIVPNFDGKKIIIAYTEKGAEVATLKVMNVDTKKFLSDEINAVAGVDTWAFDNSGFFYTWIKSADNTDSTSRLNPKTRFHKIGDDPKKDADFFSNEAYPELKIEEKAYPGIVLSKFSKEYVFAYLGTVQREMQLYYAPISQLNSGKIQWKPLATTNDKIVRSLDVIGDQFYAITYNGAKNYKLVVTDLKKPDWANAKVIAPEKKDMTLESFVASENYLILNYTDGINSKLYKYDIKDRKTSEVKLPFNGSVNVVSLDKKTNDFIVSITSWNMPFTDFSYSPKTDTFSESPFNKTSSYPDEYKNLIVEEVEVKGHDGVKIPLSIIYKKGMKKDGSNVCFMESYGAYGISASPFFSVRKNSLAIKDVILAIPHVRGGSEKGQEWYLGGYKTTKPNTWKDFISCAEYLIKEGYTSSEKLAGAGTSAGGILITRAITERPELFAAAICNVGCANTMRGEFSSNGPVNIPEFGTVQNEAECKALHEMDGMHHVVQGTKYPAVLSIAGWNDPRVVAWQPGKFAGAMQNATSSDKPVLLKVNYDNGHFTEDKDVTYANFADQYAFIMWQTGHPDFKMK
ncbi:prolyl oligopeptidase family serine peptidase [Flavobacterium macacae]|uniref:prolyl oligopeptidase n=1 Tax=Flavobacterium macacae TaxID=2488993 RepID=A0A3P3W8P8_9FLAO|nr:prolyl oligopeptidase family serine peptidase [Flavobacterium macacae]RRJ91074.1 S9 family peptidase [Flavobacterium macacae]